MNRIDAEAPRESITRRTRRGGTEVDAFAANRSADGYRPGERRAIKARHNSRVRAGVRVQLARYTTV
jgi:hypothetical protein